MGVKIIVSGSLVGTFLLNLNLRDKMSSELVNFPVETYLFKYYA